VRAGGYSARLPGTEGRTADSMTTQQAMDDRTTEHLIIVAFLNWTEHILYDSRRTPYDIPPALRDYPVESIHIVDDTLTIIEI